ncbi:MAG: hypothetical protein WAK93_13935 [Solirubrobacteraceae bacterium]
MSDLLAIFGPPETDAEVLGEISRLHPSRVTVLVEDVDVGWAYDDSPSGARLRERLASLLTAIETGTGASVAGFAGHRDQLRGWRFDREVSGHAPVPA